MNTLIIRDYGISNTPSTPVANACPAGWFLPSKDELNQIWVNRNIAWGGTTVGARVNMSTSTLDYYWTSSQWGTNLAWAQGFNLGDQDSGPKNSTTERFRPITAF